MPYICFINTEGAYGLLDRTLLLWGVRAYFGVPPPIIKAIYVFHDRVPARGQLDDEVSAWFMFAGDIDKNASYPHLRYCSSSSAQRLVDVIIQRLTVNPAIVSGLSYSGDAP